MTKREPAVCRFPFVYNRTKPLTSFFIFDWLILSLIGLFDCNIQTDQRLSCAGYAGHKADTFLLLFLAFMNNVQNIGNRPVGIYLIGFVPCDILDGVTFIE